MAKLSRLLLPIVVVLAVSISVLACSQPAAPAPKAAEPTQAVQTAPTSAPTAAQAAPTSAPAAASTTAPVKTVDYPAKGKTISLIVPFDAGGPVDLTSRLLAPLMEKELGVPVQVVNRPGASTQVGMAELVASKPDGYTLEMPSIPTTLVTYLDTTRNATYSREDFELVASVAADATTISTAASSPYMTLNDVIEAAKANPEKVTAATAGVGGVTHLTGVALQEAAGVKLAFVHFTGGSPSTTAALAGHTDVAFSSMGAVRGLLKSGELRVLALFDREESPLLAGVKTAVAQDFNVQGDILNGIIVPAGTPKEVKDILESAIKKATSDKEFVEKLQQVGLVARFKSQDEYTSHWAGMEDWTKRYMDQAK